MPEFATCPVGPTPGMATKFVPGGLGGRIFAAETPVLPVTVYRLDVFVPWFEIQKGLPGRLDTPQVFFRFESVMAARPGMSETRSVCLNCAWAVPAPAHSAPKATPVNMTA